VCIFWQTFMEYGGNKSIKENSLRPWVLIPEDNRHLTVTRKIPLFSTLDSLHNSRLHFYFKIYSLKDISNLRYSNQKTITFYKYSLPANTRTIMSSLIFTCKNCLDWDIFHYFYFFTKYIHCSTSVFNSEKMKSSYIYHIIWRIYHCCFVRFCMTFLIYIHVRNGTKNEFWDCKQFLQVKINELIIVRVGDGDGFYGEQWNLSGDRQVSIVLRD
jgi:hypothetical protein